MVTNPCRPAPRRGLRRVPDRVKLGPGSGGTRRGLGRDATIDLDPDRPHGHRAEELAMALTFHYAARSDVGLVRKDNQDSGYAGPHLLVVADGMGGHAGGDLASSTAIAAMAAIDGDSLTSGEASDALDRVIHEANARIGRIVDGEPELLGMGTTVTALLRARNKLVLAHIGDSRAYLLREGELTQLLSDRTADSARKRGLLANVLYGKVTMFTEALVLQAISRPEQNPIDDVAALADSAADLQDRTIARVTAAGELNEGQQAVLAEKLGKIYGRAMSIHSEVDTSLLGGMRIRVGDEVIDGSTAGKIARLRAQMA